MFLIARRRLENLATFQTEMLLIVKNKVLDMAILKMKKIKEMSQKEINDNLSELKLELSKERAASEIGTAKSPGRIRAIRKSLARIKTVINMKK